MDLLLLLLWINTSIKKKLVSFSELVIGANVLVMTFLIKVFNNEQFTIN